MMSSSSRIPRPRSAACALALLLTCSCALPASGAVLVGFYDFLTDTNPETHDAATTGFSGSFSKGSSGTSRDEGGSNDNLYGNSAITTTAVVAANGFLRITPSVTMTVTYATGDTPSYNLDFLYFDATTTSGSAPTLNVTYSINDATPVSLSTVSPGMTGASDTATRDYDDFGLSLATLALSPGDKIEFVFSSSSMRLDNIALTGSAVPEPGVASLLALGTFGLLSRRRRR